MCNKWKAMVPLLWLCVSVGASGKIIPANTEGYQYTGRIDFANSDTPYLTWSGSAVKAKFTGQSLSVRLNDERGKNYFNIIVDGEAEIPYVIHTKEGVHDYWISDTLSAGDHTVEIYKRTEGADGGTYFHGIGVGQSDVLLKLPPKTTRRIEIYGDSITSGMGNVAPYNAVDNLERDKNHYLSYGAIAARNLGAELHTISQSGIGLMVSWFDFTMPQFYDQLSAVGNNDTQWDFTLWQPQVVVINLFQNDSWIVAEKDRLPSIPTEREIVQSYKDFIQTLRGHYSDAHIICALGSMDVVREGSPWPGYVETAVAELTRSGEHKLSTLVFPFNGYEPHPRVNQHKSNAEILTQTIRDLTGWE